MRRVIQGIGLAHDIADIVILDRLGDASPSILIAPDLGQIPAAALLDAAVVVGHASPDRQRILIIEILALALKRECLLRILGVLRADGFALDALEIGADDRRIRHIALPNQCARSAAAPVADLLLGDVEVPVINQGLAGEDIIKNIHKELFNLPIEEKAKIDLLEKIGEYEFRLNQGGTPEIQLLALLSQFLKYKK